jgi:HK97 family phage major capsid protein
MMIERQAHAFGQWAKAIKGDEKAREWCAMNKVATTVSNTGGGFVVPSELGSEIWRLVDTFSSFRSNANLVNLPTGNYSMPRITGGLTSYFVGEVDSITQSDVSGDWINFHAKKLGVLARISQEVEEDSAADFGAALAREFAIAIGNKLDDCGWNGDGTSTYAGMRGVANAIIDGTHTASAIDAASAHDTTAEYDLADINSIIAALPDYAQQGAAFYCSPKFFALVLSRLGAAGGAIGRTVRNGRDYPTFAGFPVITSPKLSSSTADVSDTAVLFFGRLDLAASLGMRRELVIKRSDSKGMETGTIWYTATCRFDVIAHDLGDNSTAGPLVALIAE